MHNTLYLFIAFIVMGIVIYLLNKYTRTSSSPTGKKSTIVEKKPAQNAEERPEGCCGAHEVCEKESLLTSRADIVYFADEELDLYRGRSASSYSDNEVDEFEDVLLTLKESEVAEWLKSIQLRGIELPETVKSQALMIISERRSKI